MKKKQDDTPVVTIDCVHAKRVTGWTADCSEHGPIPSKGKRDHARIKAVEHAQQFHGRDVVFRDYDP